jgi:hypothetical protein
VHSSNFLFHEPFNSLILLAFKLEENYPEWFWDPALFSHGYCELPWWWNWLESDEAVIHGECMRLDTRIIWTFIHNISITGMNFSNFNYIIIHRIYQCYTSWVTTFWIVLYYIYMTHGSKLMYFDNNMHGMSYINIVWSTG